MEAVVSVRDVKKLRSRSGNVRFVLVDDGGREHTTFRDEMGRRAAAATGSGRASSPRVGAHGYTNVYLHAVEPADEPAGAGGDEGDEERVEEVA